MATNIVNMKKAYISNINNNGMEFSATVTIKDATKELSSVVLRARTESEFNRSVSNLLALHDQAEIEVAKIKEGEWVKPKEPTPEPTPEPTQKELDKAAYDAAKVKLTELKGELDLQLITEAEYQVEVDKVKALKK